MTRLQKNSAPLACPSCWFATRTWKGLTMNRFSLLAGILVSTLALLPGCRPVPNQGSGSETNTSQGASPVTHSPAAGTDTVEGTRWGDVDAALDAWQPVLKDAQGDAVDGNPAHDLRQVMMVMTQDDLLVRYKLGFAQAESEQGDMRFWLEQGNRFITVETKSTAGFDECTITEAGASTQFRVEPCFRTAGDTVDIAIPRKELPSSLDQTKDFWISGPQVCCIDEARSEPIDKLDASQVVWRAPNGS